MTTDCGEYEKMIEIPLASCEYVHKRKPRTLKKSKFIKRFNALLKRETKSDNVSAQASSAEGAEESKSLKLSCEDCASCDCVSYNAAFYKRFKFLIERSITQIVADYHVAVIFFRRRVNFLALGKSGRNRFFKQNFITQFKRLYRVAAMQPVERGNY